jgi:pimeloyl-ACP methyl ester carboxylesterase
MHVIYIPGLGDHRSHLQQLAVKFWPIFGVKTSCYLMRWNDKEPFAPKLSRLLAMIDELARSGDKVSLVGTSAGASAVLNAYAARPDKIAGVVCICGKINNPPAHSPRYIENPAFKESLMELQRVLPKLGPKQRARIMSIRPLADNIVLPADTIIPGAREKLVPTVGHAFSIGATLVFGAAMMMRFLQKQDHA